MRWLFHVTLNLTWRYFFRSDLHQYRNATLIMEKLPIPPLNGS
jgi:hypothetical protein